MVTIFDNSVKIPVKEYKSLKENGGKVAIFNFDSSELVAEGDNGEDWTELELMCEELRENGNYRIVIVPPNVPQIHLYKRVIE